MLPSIAIIVGHAFAFHLVRKALRSTGLSDTHKDFLLAGLSSYELGCLALEQGVLMERAGFAIWAASLFLVVVWQVVNCLSPNPISHLLKGSGQGIACALFMLCCSLLSYRHMSTVWSLELVSQHKGRAMALSSAVCHLPWRNLHLLQVMGCELVGTFLLCLLPSLIIENQTLANNDSSRVWRGVLVAVTVLAVVISGMETSGAMYNPTLASLLVGGCKGFSTGQHLLVYWITPLVGAAFASVLQQYITRPSVSTEKKRK